MAKLSEEELHHLAMNVVGKDMEENGFEFMAINSKLKKNPQFVGLKDKDLHFVIVRAIAYPDDPKEYDAVFMQTIKEHADKFEAKVYWAGVGVANAKDYDLPVTKEEDYLVNYGGLIEI